MKERSLESLYFRGATENRGQGWGAAGRFSFSDSHIAPAALARPALLC